MSAREELECKRDGCEIKFYPKVHNQRFCSKECCRVYTNARILANYHEKKNRVTKGRVCTAKGCTTLLSRYNEDNYCSIHQQKNHVQKLRSWGWDIKDGDLY